MLKRANPVLVALIVMVSLAAGCTNSGPDAATKADEVAARNVEGYVAACPVIEGDYLFLAAGTSKPDKAGDKAADKADGAKAAETTDQAAEKVNEKADEKAASKTGGRIFKIHRKTGDTAWKSEPLGGHINNTPVVTEDALIVVTGNGALIALEKETGKIKWKRTADGEKEEGLVHEGKPIRFQRVTRCVGHDPATGLLVVGDKKGLVAAFAIRDGTPKWKKKLSDWVAAPPVFQDNVVYLVAMNGDVCALDLATGDRVWAPRPAEEKKDAAGH
jgi:outer membrane protein assembly factor BamB